MKIGLLSSAVLASVLALSAFGCAATPEEEAAASEQHVESSAREVKASAEPRLASLGLVWDVRSVSTNDNINLTIIEAGGGDPGLNGNQLFLSAYGPKQGKGGVFELGLNISQLTGVDMVGDTTVRLTGTFENHDAENKITKNPFEAFVQLTLVGNDIQKDVRVTRGGNTTTVTATTDESREFFSEIFRVRTKNTKEGTVVRLFDTGKESAPKMNGGHLALSIMSFPEEKIYDLGLDILGIASFELAGETEARITGTENFMDHAGEVQMRPFAYTINFAIGQDGSPAEVINVTRTN